MSQLLHLTLAGLKRQLLLMVVQQPFLSVTSSSTFKTPQIKHQLSLIKPFLRLCHKAHPCHSKVLSLRAALCSQPCHGTHQAVSYFLSYPPASLPLFVWPGTGLGAMRGAGPTSSFPSGSALSNGDKSIYFIRVIIFLLFMSR